MYRIRKIRDNRDIMRIGRRRRAEDFTEVTRTLVCLEGYREVQKPLPANNDLRPAATAATLFPTRRVLSPLRARMFTG